MCECVSVRVRAYVREWVRECECVYRWQRECVSVCVSVRVRAYVCDCVRECVYVYVDGSVSVT